jgi:hypothetical protein
MGFEPTIPVFERAKTVHAVDRAATVIGFFYSGVQKTFSDLLPYLVETAAVV